MDKVHPAHTSRPLITAAGAAGVRAGGNRLHLTSLAVGTDHRQCHHWKWGPPRLLGTWNFCAVVFPGYCKRLHAGLVAPAVRSAGVGWGGRGRGGGSGLAGSRQSNAQSRKAEGA